MADRHCPSFSPLPYLLDFKSQPWKTAHVVLRLARSRQTNTTWPGVSSKGPIWADAMETSWGGSSFSCVRGSAQGSGASTNHPRWLPAGCRAQGAQGTLCCHRASPWTPTGGPHQQPEITCWLPPPTQLGFKHSLNYSCRAGKSRSTDAKALLQPPHRPTCPEQGWVLRRHRDGGQDKARCLAVSAGPHLPQAPLWGTNWASTSYSPGNILPLAERIKRSTGNLSSAKCHAPI